MSVDYEKLMNLEYTAYEHSQDFQKKLGENQINYPVIDVRRDYDKDIPVVEVRAEDHIEGTVYKDRYRLEEITKEEFEKVMFEIWKDTIEDLEQY